VEVKELLRERRSQASVSQEPDFTAEAVLRWASP